jgi:hypothetical protein
MPCKIFRVDTDASVAQVQADIARHKYQWRGGDCCLYNDKYMWITYSGDILFASYESGCIVVPSMFRVPTDFPVDHWSEIGEYLFHYDVECIDTVWGKYKWNVVGDRATANITSYKNGRVTVEISTRQLANLESTSNFSLCKPRPSGGIIVYEPPDATPPGGLEITPKFYITRELEGDNDWTTIIFCISKILETKKGKSLVEWYDTECEDSTRELLHYYYADSISSETRTSSGWKISWKPSVVIDDEIES